jgi:hypothetical protein
MAKSLPLDAGDPVKEFNLCLLGCEGVGKTSLAKRLCGTSFSRSKAYVKSTEDEPIRYSVEVATSKGLLLLHLHDWAWEEKKKGQNINQQLMRGRDAAFFVYDVTEKRTKQEFSEFADWYQRAAGFAKPWVIVSNKNDQKKRAVNDDEGKALARQGDKRVFCPVNLVDDVGLDDLVTATVRLLMDDVNMTVHYFKAISAEHLKWSEDRLVATTAGLGMGGLGPKSKRVMLVVMNRSVVEKFEENFASSCFLIEHYSSVGEAEEELADVASTGLPVYALLAPPTITEGQKVGLTELASKFNIKFVLSIPRGALDAVLTNK